MSILRRTVTTLGTLIATASLSLLGATTAIADPATEVSMTPASIDSFSIDAGKPEWAGPTRDRLGRTVFTVSSDGTFVMDQPDGYPTLNGTVEGDGTFEGSAGSSVGSTGSTDSEVSGHLTATNDGVRMDIVYTAGSVTVANVNDTPFSASSSKAYTASMTMRAA